MTSFTKADALFLLQATAVIAGIPVVLVATIALLIS